MESCFTNFDYYPDFPFFIDEDILRGLHGDDSIRFSCRRCGPLIHLDELAGGFGCDHRACQFKLKLFFTGRNDCRLAWKRLGKRGNDLPHHLALRYG